MQPVMILGAFFSLGVLQQSTPYLASSWYIEEFTAGHEGGKDGTVLTVKLREQFQPRDTTSAKGIMTAIAGETLSPLAGASMGQFF